MSRRDDHEPWESFPLVEGKVCRACRGRVRMTPGGESCAKGHGGDVVATKSLPVFPAPTCGECPHSAPRFPDPGYENTLECRAVPPPLGTPEAWQRVWADRAPPSWCPPAKEPTKHFPVKGRPRWQDPAIPLDVRTLFTPGKRAPQRPVFPAPIAAPILVFSLQELSDVVGLDEEARRGLAPLFTLGKVSDGIWLVPDPELAPSQLEAAHSVLREESIARGEEERARHQLVVLRGLLDTLELHLDDSAPPGPSAGQQVAHAASDLAAYVARLDLARRAVRSK